MNTSITHPLRIETVAPLGSSGLIGMTLLPGRKSEGLSGTWYRDLDSDLAVVRAWKPDVAIALLEEHEFALHGVPDFRDRVLEAKLPWEFAPIRDGAAPGPEFAAAWPAIRAKAHRALERGGRVLIHCKAGLGRTGMLAAMLLIDFGEATEAAIARVRATRKNTIEDNQEEYLLRS